MKTKHTPGPWEISRWKDARLANGFETVISDSRGHGLVTFCQKGKNKKVEANARLIAAAPDLLAALENALAESVGQPSRRISREGLDDIRAAIAQARSTT